MQIDAKQRSGNSTADRKAVLDGISGFEEQMENIVLSR